MADNKNDPLYGLLSTVGEIASDVKHILASQSADRKTVRDMDARLTKEIDALKAQVKENDRFRFKMLGVATAIPTALVVISWFLKGMI
jgi:hypothetical protein